MRVSANYFDGISSQLNPVEIEVLNETLIVYHKVRLQFPLSDIKINDNLGSAYLSIELPNSGRVECPGIKNREQLGIKNTGVLLRFLETGFAGVLISIAAMGVGIWATAVFVLPALTSFITPKVPSIIFEQVDGVTLKQLDERVLKPTEIEDAKLKEIQGYFDLLNKNSERPGDYWLQFRATKKFLPNAFTLSGSTIVVTDDLVKLLETKEAIGAILAHELGHQELDHVKKSLVRVSSAAVFIAITTGDFANTIGQLSTALWQLGLSRENEFEADDFAAKLLKIVGSDPKLLASGLEKLEKSVEEKKGIMDDFESVFKLIETHPDTNLRVQRLNNFK